jgi:hypothetical protein
VRDRLRLGLSPADVADLPREALLGLLVEVQALYSALFARLLEPGFQSPPVPDGARLQPGQAPSPGSEDRWLTPSEVAALANVPRRVVYGWSRRSDWRGFTRRLSRKVLRVEERGFRRWWDGRGAR